MPGIICNDSSQKVYTSKQAMILGEDCRQHLFDGYFSTKIVLCKCKSMLLNLSSLLIIHFPWIFSWLIFPSHYISVSDPYSKSGFVYLLIWDVLLKLVSLSTHPQRVLYRLSFLLSLLSKLTLPFKSYLNFSLSFYWFCIRS